MDWEEAVKQCDRILGLCEQITADEGQEYKTSVTASVTSMREKLVRFKDSPISEGKQRALANWERGAIRWTERNEEQDDDVSF